MEKRRLIIAMTLVCAVCIGLLACDSKKINLQTEDDVIEYLEDYFEKNDKWSDIAFELNIYYSVAGSSELLSSSFAQKEDDHWLAVLHGSIDGYADANKTKKETFDVSYVVQITGDGQVTELFIQAGHVTTIYYE